MKRKLFWIFAAIYLLISSFTFLPHVFQSVRSLRFLYSNQTTVLRVEAAQTEHRTRFSHYVTRFFYNKPMGYFQSYLDSAYRSLDIPFLFTLTTGSSMYDDQGPMQMLFPWELLLFIPAIIFLIRSENKKYVFFVYYFLVITLLAAFFLPSLNQAKLFPEIIGIRLVIIFGLYEGVKKWLKK